MIIKYKCKINKNDFAIYEHNLDVTSGVNAWKSDFSKEDDKEITMIFNQRLFDFKDAPIHSAITFNKKYGISPSIEEIFMFLKIFYPDKKITSWSENND
jgi:hypothetical protein